MNPAAIGLLYLMDIHMVSFRDFEPWFRPKVLWVEWWVEFVFVQETFKGEECSEGSQKLFNVGRKLGYNIYRSVTPQ